MPDKLSVVAITTESFGQIPSYTSDASWSPECLSKHAEGPTTGRGELYEHALELRCLEVGMPDRAISRRHHP